MHDRQKQQVIRQRWPQHGCESRNRRGSGDRRPADSLLPLAAHPPTKAPTESTDRKDSDGRYRISNTSSHGPRIQHRKADFNAHAAPRGRREGYPPKASVPPTSGRQEVICSSILAPGIGEVVCSCIITSWVQSISVFGFCVPPKSHVRPLAIFTSYRTFSATASTVGD